MAAPASFCDAVASAGLEHRLFADVPAELLGLVFGRMASLTLEEANATVVADVFGRLDARAALPGRAAAIEDRGLDVVPREPAALGSLVAARAAGVRHVRAIGMIAR